MKNQVVVTARCHNTENQQLNVYFMLEWWSPWLGMQQRLEFTVNVER